jgi:phosphate transport system permease protein
MLRLVESTAFARPVAEGQVRKRLDRLADLGLHGLAGAAALGSLALIGLLTYVVVDKASLSIGKFGLGFLWHRTWDPVALNFGALDFIFGTAYTSALAILIAGPISIGIGLYLSELAPTQLRTIIGTLIEMLAAVPSVVIGLWGILVLGPFVANDLGPALQSAFGFLPFFQGTPRVAGLLPAVIVLTIMVIPITSSLSRELFLSVPNELEEGALGLGLTRWEMVRGVILPYTRSGVIAAVFLGLGRAVGEAIAVTQVIGITPGIHISLFAQGDTLASRVASEYQSAASNIHLSSLVYLGLILLVFALVTNVIAQFIVARFSFQRTGGS